MDGARGYFHANMAAKHDDIVCGRASDPAGGSTATPNNR